MTLGLGVIVSQVCVVSEPFTDSLHKSFSYNEQRIIFASSYMDCYNYNSMDSYNYNHYYNYSQSRDKASKQSKDMILVKLLLGYYC